ncbi:MAG: TrmH family RNA methyltransferase [Mycobacteriales bacterium]
MLGRNAALEAMRAGLPALSLQLARGLGTDPRVTELVGLAQAASLPVVQVARSALDAYGPAHQGVALVSRPFCYRHPDELLQLAEQRGEPALIVACDGVSDPRNIGAIARSAAAFGAHGLLLPLHRAAGITPAAWKVSAGALARLPVARATNLTRALRGFGDRGVELVGLAADGTSDVTAFEVRGPLAVVLGAEGRGLSRLVREACDCVVRIGHAAEMESLNVAVAAGVVLHEVRRRRVLAEELGGRFDGRSPT